MTPEEFKQHKPRLTPGRVVIITFIAATSRKKLTHVYRVVETDDRRILIRINASETTGIDVDRITRIVFLSNWMFVELLRNSLGLKKAMDDLLISVNPIPKAE